MKKLLSICLIGTLVLTLCSCGKQEPTEIPQEEPAATSQEEPAATSQEEPAAASEEGIAQIANPIVTYDSLDELNAVCGLKLSAPAVMGVTDEVFQTLPYEDSLIGEYCFSVNGTQYVLRGSAVMTGDISGVYVGEGTAFSGLADFEDASVSTEEMKLSRWYTVDGQYVLMVKDGGTMDADTFESITNEMHTLTTMGYTEADLTSYYESLAGTYQDRVGGRAMMTAEAVEGGLHITVSWGNSAFETCIWEMTASLGEDGLLNYTDGTSSTSTAAEDGSITVAENSTGENGFFSEAEGVLCWNGAPDENCQNCEFEKLPA